MRSVQSVRLHCAPALSAGLYRCFNLKEGQPNVNEGYHCHAQGADAVPRMQQSQKHATLLRRSTTSWAAAS